MHEKTQSESNTLVEYAVNNIAYVMGEWSEKTFPQSTDLSILNHLNEEIDELEEALVSNDKKKIGEEIADMIALLFHLAFKHQIYAGDEILNKFKINQKRKWTKKPNEKGYYKHLCECLDYCEKADPHSRNPSGICRVAEIKKRSK